MNVGSSYPTKSPPAPSLSGLQIKSELQQRDFNALSIPDAMVQWKDAYMIFGITDLRGITHSY